MNDLTNYQASMPARQAFDFAGSLQVADLLSKSNLLPQQFQGNPSNVLIALNLASRLNADVFYVMQSMYVVHGRPSFSGQFYIACVNSCGRYTPIAYEEKKDDAGKTIACRVITTELRSKQKIEGPWVSLEMATKEGWLKNNPKWSSMPELMLRYRAAAFFVRSFCPDVTMGIPSDSEAQDIPQDESRSPMGGVSTFAKLQDAILEAKTAEDLDLISEEIKLAASLTKSELSSLRTSYKTKSAALKGE